MPIAVPVKTIEVPEPEEDTSLLEEKPAFVAQSAKTFPVPAEPKAESGYKDFDVTKYDN